MRLASLVAVVAGMLATTGCGAGTGAASSAQSPPTSTGTSTGKMAQSGLVGRWTRVTTCLELVADLKRAGLEQVAPYAWLAQTSSNGQGSFSPGSPKPTTAHPCTGAIPRKHSHFFTSSGQFGSLDWLGGQVDDGLYRLLDAHTVYIGSPPTGAAFHYRIQDDKLTLTPVITTAMRRKAAANPHKFSAAGWAISVAYAGHAWTRVACQGSC
jgi:hypothetical protein